MNSEIQVKIITVNGISRIYPITDSGKLLCRLWGGVTFNDSRIDILKRLGYVFEVVFDDTTIP